jgi:hypothetical protein
MDQSVPGDETYRVGADGRGRATTCGAPLRSARCASSSRSLEAAWSQGHAIRHSRASIAPDPVQPRQPGPLHRCLAPATPHPPFGHLPPQGGKGDQPRAPQRDVLLPLREKMAAQRPDEGLAPSSLDLPLGHALARFVLAVHELHTLRE